jgi:amino acid transporter
MEERQGLRRELRFIEAIALSLAIMAPTAAMALNGTAVAGQIGRAVPLAFLIATIGVLFVSYGFVRLTRYFNAAGSVFALAGATLGPRAGFGLMGTYTLFTIASSPTSRAASVRGWRARRGCRRVRGQARQLAA